MKKHYMDVVGWAACGVHLTADHPGHAHRLTAVPRLVTCNACKRTKDYREMMEESPPLGAKQIPS